MTHEDLARDVVSQLVHIGEWTEADAARLILEAIEEAVAEEAAEGVVRQIVVDSARAIDEAVAREREACARTVEVKFSAFGEWAFGRSVAASIRARGKATDASPSPSSPASGTG